MGKIILKDKTEIEVKQMPSISSITVAVADVNALQQLKNMLTEDNISSVQTTNAAGLVVGNYYDMVLVENWTIRWLGEGIEAVFGLREKTEVEILEDKVTKSQAVQDGAIADLGEAVSMLSEGV